MSPWNPSCNMVPALAHAQRFPSMGRTEYYANRVDVELTIEGMALTV